MKKIILAIEDDEEVLRVYQTLFRDSAEVRVARTLAQARELLAGVDLILLDYHLRDDTVGFEDRLIELRDKAPVLVCSGLPDPRVPALGVGLGAVGYWNKGTGLETLRRKVQALLGTASAADSSH